MAQMLAVVGGGDLGTHAVLAGEALRKAAARLGQALDLELRRKGVGGNPLAESAIARGDSVLPIGEGDLGEVRFGTMRKVRIGIEEVLTDADSVLGRFLAGGDSAPAGPRAGGRMRIVAITSCPTGIAHTFMAAEGIQAAA